MNKHLARSMLDLTQSNEAIAFQDGKFFTEMTVVVNALRDINFKAPAAEISKALDAVNFNAVVKRFTNMELYLTVRLTNNIGASVCPVSFTKNHVFNSPTGRAHEFKLETHLEAIRNRGGREFGAVDRKTGKVHGVYAETTTYVFITAGLLMSSHFTDGEIAAILLHEIGHAFTFFEYTGKYLTVNAVLAAATATALDNEPFETRTHVLVESASTLGVKIPELEKLAKIKDPTIRSNAIQVVFMRALYEKNQSGSGTGIYDYRVCEQSADIFATRHGAGREIVTGLDKLLRYGDPAYLTTATYCAMEFVKMLGGTLMVAATMGLYAPYMLAMFLFVKPEVKIYDSATARFTLVRQQLVEELKLTDLTVDRRRALLDDVMVVNNIVSNMKDRRTLWELLQTTVVPSMRRDFKMEVLQKQLESLIANDLFVAAAKFKHGETV